MEFIYEYGLFLAQAVTFVAAVLIVVAGILSLSARQRGESQGGQIELLNLNEKYRHIGETFREVIDEPEALKLHKKSAKKDEKAKTKIAKKKHKKGTDELPEERRKRLYVLGFDGDVKASATENLREEISAVLPQIEKGDKRILMINGEPVPYFLARIPLAGETRGNLAAGGTGQPQPLSERDQWIAAQVGPSLREKGLLFVGLDVIGDYLTEINVTSPTCIREIDAGYGLDIGGQLMECIVEALAKRR